ncbi:MAG TPA: ATP-binding protein [Longimicrobium sp.]|nr:ATP-binding protein [Longimicrobium sp.]
MDRADNLQDQQSNDGFDHVPPAADALLESFRGMGYSPGAAIADLIDNSIAAGARRVRVEFIWRAGGSVVRIVDDGRGMTEAELVEAMRPGGRNPLARREADDLGRFGLGLKTAALSQGRVLAVASRSSAEKDVVRSWDLDYVAGTREWRLLRAAPDDVNECVAVPEGYPTGTTIVVGRLDRLVGDADNDARLRFLAVAGAVERHLAMTFHRYLEGNRPQLELHIGSGDTGRKIEPWDPFLQSHPATTSTPLERLPNSGGVEVQGFVLPHRDRMTAAEFETAAGPDGWLAHEGFFVYRNRRLLVAGGWLGLGPGRRWTRDDVHRLARIRLDLPNSVDEEWKVDIRKSAAVPPPAFRERLQRLADQVRKNAREVFAWRGGITTKRTTSSPLVSAWTAMESRRGSAYRIDRAHPAVERALEQSGGSRKAVEEMLTVLESTLPVQRIWLDVVEKGDLPVTSSEMPPDQKAVLRSLYAHMRTALGLSADAARARLLSVEPFSSYPADISLLPDNPA